MANYIVNERWLIGKSGDAEEEAGRIVAAAWDVTNTTSNFAQFVWDERVLLHNSRHKMICFCQKFWRKEVSSLKSELSDRNPELYRLRDRNSQMMEAKLGFSVVKKLDKWLIFFARPLNVSVVMWVVNCVSHVLQPSLCWRSRSRSPYEVASRPTEWHCPLISSLRHTLLLQHDAPIICHIWHAIISHNYVLPTHFVFISLSALNISFVRCKTHI